MADVQREVTMELLADLAKAVQAVAKDILPSLPLRIRVTPEPSPSIVITVAEGAKPVYGHIIKAKPAWLRPSIQPLRADATVRRVTPRQL